MKLDHAFYVMKEGFYILPLFEKCLRFQLSICRDHSEDEELYLVCDNHCLPPVIGLVISQFHDLKVSVLIRSNNR
jgi:hypothetical protein